MDQSTADYVVKQGFDLWITPEVAKRQAAGTIPTPFELHAAQIIFPPEGGFYVRLNDEVKGIGYARAKRAVEKGEQVLQSDLEGLEAFDVSEEDLDNGHFTIIRLQERWMCTFNFLRSRAYCASLLEKSRQFLHTARAAQEVGHNAPAVDNLFSASELASKVYLLLHMTITRDTKTHGPIRSAINRERQLNNVDHAFVDLFNRLAQQRQAARYNAGMQEAMYLDNEHFDLVQLMIERCNERCQIAKPNPIPQTKQFMEKVDENNQQSEDEGSAGVAGS